MFLPIQQNCPPLRLRRSGHATRDHAGGRRSPGNGNADIIVALPAKRVQRQRGLVYAPCLQTAAMLRCRRILTGGRDPVCPCPLDLTCRLCVSASRAAEQNVHTKPCEFWRLRLQAFILSP
jgi:hypothetical protein